MVIFLLLCLVGMAKAEEVEINFDDYNLGDLNGQNNWTQNKRQYEVVNDIECYSNYCISATDDNNLDNTYTSRKFATTSKAYFKYEIRFEELNHEPTEQTVFLLQINNASNIGQYFFRKSTSTNNLAILRSTGGKIITIIDDLAWNTLHTIKTYIDCESQTGWLSANNNNPISISDIINIDCGDKDGFDTFTTYNQNGVENWIDNIYISNTVPSYNENYDFDLAQDEPDFNTAPNITCIFGEDCKMWFSFNELAIGYPMYLINYASSTIPSNAIASTTITDDVLWQNYVLVPEQPTEGKYQYNLLLDAEVFGWIVETGINVNWWSTTTFNAWVESTITDNLGGYCAEEVICSDITENPNSFVYGFICGFRKTLCWALTPTDGSIKNITNSINALQASFPFNMVFGFINRAKTIINEQELENNSINIIPFINTDAEFVMLPAISSSTMQNAFGTSFDTIKTGMEYLTWLFFGGVSLLIVKKTI